MRYYTYKENIYYLGLFACIMSALYIIGLRWIGAFALAILQGLLGKRVSQDPQLEAVLSEWPPYWEGLWGFAAGLILVLFALAIMNDSEKRHLGK